MAKTKPTGWVTKSSIDDNWELLIESSNVETGESKSTKRLRVENGYLYQVSTKGPDGYAEALQFVATLQAPQITPTLKQQARRIQPGLRHR